VSSGSWASCRRGRVPSEYQVGCIVGVMRPVLLGVLLGLTLGCTALASQRESAREVWEARQIERARDCLRAGGQWAAGACNFRAPS
jgi:hypothetical protein